jgi:chromosome transmission fidelity protein 4
MLTIENSEANIKLIDLEDTSKICILTGHARGVRRASWHPSGSILVSSTFIL